MARGNRQEIERLTGRFYTVIPHSFGRQRPPLIQTADQVKAKFEMCNVLSDIETAQVRDAATATPPSHVPATPPPSHPPLPTFPGSSAWGLHAACLPCAQRLVLMHALPPHLSPRRSAPAATLSLSAQPRRRAYPSIE